jgi:hypothetical protein
MYNLFTIGLFSYLDWRKGEGFGETWQRYKKKWKRARKGEKIMKNVAQDEADYIYNLTIYYVQFIYNLVILYCRPLSDTRRISAEH